MRRYSEQQRGDSPLCLAATYPCLAVGKDAIPAASGRNDEPLGSGRRPLLCFDAPPGDRGRGGSPVYLRPDQQNYTVVDTRVVPAVQGAEQELHAVFGGHQV